MSSIMSPQREVAQRLLDLARAKIEKETSAAEPSLLRLLVCANMADNACQSMREDALRQRSIEKGRSRGGQSTQAASDHLPGRSLPASARSRKFNCMRTSHPEHVKPIYPSRRPQVSLCDRATFRKCIDQGDEETIDDAIESDLESTESDPTFSYDDYRDDDNGRFYSRKEDADFQIRRNVIKPTQRLRSTTVSYTYTRR
jgi:hypothetical protein